MTLRRKSKHSLERIKPPFCGEPFLEDLITAIDRIYTMGGRREFRIERDRALIASLFLTGARPTEVVKLRKSSFDFDNKEARKNNAFLVKEFELMKHGTKGQRAHVTRKFPIWKDDPLVDYLTEWYDKVDDYLFPSPSKKGKPHLSYAHVNSLAKKVGDYLPTKKYIIPLWFRRQREFYLAEKRGFSISNIKAYMKLKQIQENPTKRKEWQNLLVIAKDFQQAKLPIKKSAKTLIIPITKLEEAVKIMKLLTTTNFLFKAKKRASLFREDNLKLITELFTPCKNEPQFITKIARLTNLFDVPLRPLRKLVKNPEEKGSIKLVEQWLRDQRRYDPNMVKTWENIVTLRNAEPIHANISSDKASWILDALTFFDSSYPIDNYSTLWDKILDKFIISLESWQKILQGL